ncbi:hypothetical protein BDA96_02G400700 [Sorghum bicolor]|uniref:Uncharacterized protein n=2 Tax=Sorghum bicolor TaxID=4558 RepID=A0A921RTF9_SORBI|nr:hypothetical protein BDA96_02G400700 [Sorghum bicolor]KXG36742.1 hypothetical protein SORBI_3002G381800 [Sorghum bicolor]
MVFSSNLLSPHGFSNIPPPCASSLKSNGLHGIPSSHSMASATLPCIRLDLAGELEHVGDPPLPRQVPASD